MKLYRIDKLAKIGGAIIKRKHILAGSDRQAVQQAADTYDCPARAALDYLGAPRPRGLD